MTSKKKTFLEKDDPLNSPGKGKNPLTLKKYSNLFKENAERWKNFPVYKRASEFLNIFDKNDVILINSGTGTGKTVIIPKLVLAYYNYEKKVIVTTPKQKTTKEAAEYGAVTLDVKIGEEVGFKFKDSPVEGFDKEKVKLLYATDGTIVSFMRSDPTIKDYSCIIIDEAHERKINIDFLFLLLKNILIIRKTTKNPLKLVIMSATINSTIFSEYFNVKPLSFNEMVFEAVSNYEVKSIFSPKPINDENFVKETVSIIDNLRKNKEEGDIIIFTTSKVKAVDLCKHISQFSEIICIEFYSGMPLSDQELAISSSLYKQKFPKKKRKVIVATDVAESSITFDKIRFVIDNGKSYKRIYNPVTLSYEGGSKFITKSQIKQRKGRTGRTNPGVCFHMYTEELYESLEEFPKAELLTSDLTGDILKFLFSIKDGNEKKIKAMFKEMIEPPKEIFIDSSLNILKRLKVVTSTGLLKKPFSYTVLDLFKNIGEENIFKTCLYIYSQKNGVIEEMSYILFFIYYYENFLRKKFLNFINSNESSKVNSNETNIKVYLFDDIIGDLISYYNNFIELKLFENEKYIELKNKLNIQNMVKTNLELDDLTRDVKLKIQKCFIQVYLDIPEKVLSIDKKTSKMCVRCSKEDFVKLDRNPLIIRPDEGLFKEKNKTFVFMDRQKHFVNNIVPV